MQPVITFICTQPECSAYQKPKALTYSPSIGMTKTGGSWDERYTALKRRCPTCYKEGGSLEITFGEKTFSELGAFEEYVVGIANEARLLKKLVDRGVADEAEIADYQKKHALVKDTPCPCCGSPLIQSENKS